MMFNYSIILQIKNVLVGELHMEFKYKFSKKDYAHIRLDLYAPIKGKFFSNNFIQKFYYTELYKKLTWMIITMLIPCIFMVPYKHWYIYLIFFIMGIIVFKKYYIIDIGFELLMVTIIIRRPNAYKECLIHIDKEGIQSQCGDSNYNYLWEKITHVFYCEKYMCIFYDWKQRIDIPLYKISYTTNDIISEITKFRKDIIIKCVDKD